MGQSKKSVRNSENLSIFKKGILKFIKHKIIIFYSIAPILELKGNSSCVLVTPNLLNFSFMVMIHWIWEQTLLY